MKIIGIPKQETIFKKLSIRDENLINAIEKSARETLKNLTPFLGKINNVDDPDRGFCWEGAFIRAVIKEIADLTVAFGFTER